MVIGRDGGLRILCHSCGFACRQRVLKTFSGRSYLSLVDRIVSLQHFLANLILYEYIKKRFKSEEKFNCLFEKYLIQDDWLLKVRGHLEIYEKISRRRKLKKLKKLTKSNSKSNSFYILIDQGHQPFFLFKHQFLNFCNSFIFDFENVHNLDLIHLNDVCDT